MPAPSDTLNRPLRDLRISVTDRCNFRCPYCMPAEVFGERYEFLPRGQILTFEEISRVARIAVGLGASKVRITGGEPLLRRELEKLVSELARIPGVEDLTLTTNGTLLAEKARVLKEAGLHRVTVSLDALDPAIFRELSGRDSVGGRVPSPDLVLGAIDTAQDAGLSPIKINTVVQRGVNDGEVLPLARHFRGTGHILRFIEFMDVGTRNGWSLDRVVPSREIVDTVGREFPLEPVEPNYPGEVAERYRYKDGGGEIGLIASVTQPFCGGCTRLRLSTEGRLYTCLFAAEGHDLRDMLRTGAADDAIRDRITGVWSARTDRYSELRTAATAESPGKVEMYRIGG